MRRDTEFYAALPKKITASKLKVLYLLHGGGDDESKWFRRVPIERILNGSQTIVIMPDGGLSYYHNTVSGEAYWTYLSQELPKVVKTYLPISDKRKDTFAAGSSMGGYGALRLALKYPLSFQAAACFSGSIDMVREIALVRSDSKERDEYLSGYKMDETFYTSIFDDIDHLENSDADLFYLFQQYNGRSQILPKIYQCCGRQDFLYKFNLDLKKAMENICVDLTYEEWDGRHDWDFWEEAFRRSILWFGL